MEKKDTIFLLLIIGSIITIIFGIDVLRLALLIFAELGWDIQDFGPIPRMAMSVTVTTMIVFPIVLIIINILALKVFDENETVGIIFGFITLGLCIVSIIFIIFFIGMIGTFPGAEDLENLVNRTRGSLGICLAGQILVLVGAILNLTDQFNK